MSEEKHNSELLAQFRTLLALERNYLAEERTILAKFRTGLALALFAPSLYLYSIALNWSFTLPFLVIFYAFLTLCGARGSWTVYRSELLVKKIRKLRNSVVEKEKELINSSKPILKLFGDIMSFSIDED